MATSDPEARASAPHDLSPEQQVVWAIVARERGNKYAEIQREAMEDPDAT